jgi:hypothetical protein
MRKQRFFQFLTIFTLSSVAIFNQGCNKTTDLPSTPTTIDCSAGTIPLTWKDDPDSDIDYIVKCEVNVTGSNKLVIEPGVKVQFESGGSIHIDDNAAISAIGTSAKPIILEGKTAAQGAWKGVFINTNNVDNRLEYVTVRHAGSEKSIWMHVKAGVCMEEYGPARLAIKNCKFENNEGFGLAGSSTDNVITEFSNNYFGGNSEAGLMIPASQVGKLDAATTYNASANPNTNAWVQINDASLNSTLKSPATMKKLDTKYRVYSAFNLESKLTIEAGTTIEFASGAMLDIEDPSGAVNAVGTAASPITFKGASAGQGAWKGIYIDSDNVENKMDYCVIDGAGSETDIWLSAKCNLYVGQYRRGFLNISNSTISNSEGYPIGRYTDSNYTSSNLTFTGNTNNSVLVK